MTGVLCAMVGASGSGAILDTQTVTRGSLSTGSNPTQNYSGFGSGSFGSISDGTSNIYGGASILGLYFVEEAYTSPPVGITSRQLVLTINGSQANSGWSLMKVGSTVFSRADAGYAASTQTNWVWNIPIDNPFVSEGNPFTATTTVEWT